ncbi:MAG TPA: DUF835 domain-containing protein [Methanomassiliicoccales archaeon]|nr:DUF835 domain-containing protein [Methanomassiliicoccales archaeon]
MRMSDEESAAKGYVKGYEDGLKEAYEDIISMATKRSYTNTELMLVMKSQRVAVSDKVKARKRKIMKETGIDLITETPEHRLELEVGVAPGTSLLVQEKGLNNSLHIFNELVKGGARGLCISRYPRRQVLERIPPGCIVYWLTKQETLSDEAKEFYIQPSETANLYTNIRRFLGANQGLRTVILLEGFYYLLSNNDFNSILKIMQKLKDEVFTSNAVFILSVDPRTLQPSELRQLENELQNVYEDKI